MPIFGHRMGWDENNNGAGTRDGGGGKLTPIIGLPCTGQSASKYAQVVPYRRTNLRTNNHHRPPSSRAGRKVKMGEIRDVIMVDNNITKG